MAQVNMDSQQKLIITNATIDNAITAWMDAKIHRSGSKQTEIKYRETVQQFRQVLWNAGLDLDSDTSMVALAAQSWAGQRTSGSRDVSANTYNQRLAILSSFYSYARKHGMFHKDNPIDLVERRPVQKFSGALALEPADVKARLASIDRSSLQGQRDYTLLSVALHTGRRASELAGLRCGDVQLIGNRVRLTWKRTKGGKVMVDDLSPGVSKTFLTYLQAVYRTNVSSLPVDTPVWVAFTRNASRGGAISTQAIADIYSKYL